MRRGLDRERKIINALLVICIVAGFTCFAFFALPDQLGRSGVHPDKSVASKPLPLRLSSIVSIADKGPSPLRAPIVRTEVVDGRVLRQSAAQGNENSVDAATLISATDPSSDDMVAGGAGAAIDDQSSEATEAMAFSLRAPRESDSPIPDPPVETGADSILSSLSDRPDFKTHPRSSLAMRSAGHSAEAAAGKTPWTKTPPGLEAEVKFWKAIYAKHDKNSVVLHHPRYLGVIYDVVNISDIARDPRLSDVERQRIGENRVNARRSELAATLENLAKGSRSGSADEIKVRKLFEHIQEEDKFRRAAEDGVRSQTGQRDKFMAGLTYSGRYLGEIESLFSAYGLPRELTRLIFVESMFNTRAVSKTGASGIWQFMPATGKLYLKMNEIVDERNDPIAATHAAARLLHHNFEELGTWPLAINAYNSGRGRMKQAVEQLGTTDIVRIVREFSNPGYGFASRNFFPEFLAALEVAENADEYFGPIEHDPPLRFETVRSSHTILLPEVARVADIPLGELTELNPGFTPKARSGAKEIPAGFDIRVPAGKGELFLASAARAPSSRTGPIKHHVKRNETLQGIARMYGVEPRAIVEANAGMSWRVKIGQTLLVPVGKGRP